MSLVARTKEYDLKVGDIRQIKVQDLSGSIRFLTDGGAFTYEVFLNGESLGPAATVSDGVLAPPGGLWGSEIRIECVTTPGKLHVAYMG